MPVAPGPGTLRAGAVLFCSITAIAAAALFAGADLATGINALDLVRAGLVLVATFWLAWGAALSLIGLCTREKPVAASTAPVTARIVVLMPIHEEDPVATFSRVAAMDASLRAVTEGAGFDIAILSDTRSPPRARAEETWFLRLLDTTGRQGHIFYRRRTDTAGRKAGNIADFIRTAGAAYDFAIMLDADSLMEGTTMVEMARRMQADPDLGLLQTMPVVVGARSRFARLMQFSAAFYGPVFARGLARLQGRTGPFWGHNAIIRIRAFAQSCGLPDLPGKPPFGGPILSHDYVEAALLARAGWTVRLDPDLGGSYEEGPETLIDFAKRDRRWCQGNLQHARLLGVPGLRGWNRFVFVQGIFAYLMAPVWILFVILSIAAAAVPGDALLGVVTRFAVPVMPQPDTTQALILLGVVVVLLLGPKVLITLNAGIAGRARDFGGSLRVALAVLVETGALALVTPVLLMYQLRSVGQVLAGVDGGWPAQNRDGSPLGLGAAFAASHWIVAAGVLGLGAGASIAPGLAVWLLPLTLPMIAAPLIIAYSAAPARGRLLHTPQDAQPAAVAVLRDRFLHEWQAPLATIRAVDAAPARPRSPAGLPPG